MRARGAGGGCAVVRLSVKCAAYALLGEAGWEAKRLLSFDNDISLRADRGTKISWQVSKNKRVIQSDFAHVRAVAQEFDGEKRNNSFISCSLHGRCQAWPEKQNHPPRMDPFCLDQH